MPQHAENTRNILDAFVYKRSSDERWHSWRGDQQVREVFVNESVSLTVRAPKNRDSNYTMQLLAIVPDMPLPGINQAMRLVKDDFELPHSSGMAIEEACDRAAATAERFCKAFAKIMSETQSDLADLADNE